MNIKELTELIRKNANLPKHIAIIMDGNGRWAEQQSLPRFAGHREGINSVRAITRICGEIGIKHLTLYTFSKENWARPQMEVSALMKLLLTSIRKEIKNLHENNVKLTTIGAFQDLPKSARKGIEEGIKLTKNNTGLNLNLALSYGSRQEIIQAIKHIAKMIDLDKLKIDDINIEQFEKLLYTNEMPDPDLLIRTGGEFRISNFLLWQIAYTEIYVTDAYWPAFREQKLLEAILEFQSRERRYGKLAE
jgi:undecaprenyl diphosphate synthase